MSGKTPSADALPPQPARPSSGGTRGGLSLRTRVAVNVVAVTAIIQLVLGVVVYQYFRSTVDEFFGSRLATRLRNAAAELAPAGADAAHPPLTNQTLETLAGRTRQLLMFSSLVLVLRDEAGRVIATSEPRVDTSRLPPPRRASNGTGVHFAMVPMAHIGTGDDDKVPARTATIHVNLRELNGRPAFLTAAGSNAAAAQMIELIGRAVLLASALGLVATGCAAWFITGVSLKPLNQLHSVAEEFSLERLNQPSQLGPQVPELSQITAELEAARTRIRLALQANERFIANVSHELKTPVAVLRTEAQTLDATDIPPETRAFVRSVIEETRRLGTMVDSFLTLATVRSGRTLTTTQAVLINDIVIESLTHSAAMAKQQRVTLVPGLYDGDEDLAVAGDADLLRVLLDNLLRNAIRFSPPGGSVVTSVTADEYNAAVSVVDAGPGIPVELLSTIFERFSQNTKEAVTGRGHGLGLSIAQGIAELHGGLITTVNLPGGGCRFTLTLPRVHAGDRNRVPDSPSPEANGAGSPVSTSPITN